MNSKKSKHNVSGCIYMLVESSKSSVCRPITCSLGNKDGSNIVTVVNCYYLDAKIDKHLILISVTRRGERVLRAGFGNK